MNNNNGDNDDVGVIEQISDEELLTRGGEDAQDSDYDEDERAESGEDEIGEDEAGDDETSDDESSAHEQDDTKQKVPYEPSTTPTKYGQAKCTLCKLEFWKKSTNHKVCPNPECQTLYDIKRKEAKRRCAREKSEQEKKDRESQEKADMEAAKAAAATKVKSNAKRKPAVHGKANSQETTRKRKRKRKTAPAGQPSSAPQKRSPLAPSSNRGSAASSSHKEDLPADNTGEQGSPLARLRKAKIANQSAIDREHTGASVSAKRVSQGNPKGTGDRVYAKRQAYHTSTLQNCRAEIENILDWKLCAKSITHKGYCIINLGMDMEAANMNIHCELLEERADTPWQPRCRQGWEDGRSLILDDIPVDNHKIKNLEICKEMIDLGKSFMSRISQQMYKMKKDNKEKMTPGVAELKGKQIIEVSYVIHAAGEHKHEFVHADSMVQGDLMAIMPLTDNPDSVERHFYPYERMGFKQGPITREKEDFKTKEQKRTFVHSQVEKMTSRFISLASTCDSAARLYEEICPISKLKRGELLVYLGDALHALPAGNRKLPERLIYFRGRLADVPEPKGGNIANEAAGDLDGLKTGGDLPGATSKQAETTGSEKTTVGLGSEVTSGGVASEAHNDHSDPGTKSPKDTQEDLAMSTSKPIETSGSKDTTPSDPDRPQTEGGLPKATGKQAETTGSEKSTVGVGSEVISGGVAKEAHNDYSDHGTPIETSGSKKTTPSDPDGPQTEDSLPKATGKQAETTESEKAIVGVTSDVTSEGIAKEAHHDPDAHGVIDALRVLKYADNEVLDDAAVHNLIAAGYHTVEEAIRFYKKRYPNFGPDHYLAFKDKFVEAHNRNKRTNTLNEMKLPASIDF